MQDGIECVVCLSRQTYDIIEEDITAFVDRSLTHPRLKKFAKCPSWVSFSVISLWPVDQGIMWAANRISQGALFWDCCKNWSQMKTCTDCPCMVLWQCFQLYGAQLHEKPLLTVLWQLDSVQMQKQVDKIMMMMAMTVTTTTVWVIDKTVIFSHSFR